MEDNQPKLITLFEACALDMLVCLADVLKKPNQRINFN